MKGNFDPYVLLPFGKNLIFELGTRIRTRNYTVNLFSEQRLSRSFSSTWDI